jgi:hypothetical protein
MGKTITVETMMEAKRRVEAQLGKTFPALENRDVMELGVPFSLGEQPGGIGAPGTLYGLRIVRMREGLWVRRSWRERLFSRPWRPRTRMKWVGDLCCPPRGMFYKVGNTLYCSETTERDLTDMIEASRKKREGS